MKLPRNKTKIVCTIGPASDSPEVMEQMILAGMNVARLNFSHGEFEGHKQVIERLRATAKGAGRTLTIMADMPGPKMRIGQITGEPVYLEPGGAFTLTTWDVAGDSSLASVTFKELPKVVKPGNTLFLNDGLIQLEVKGVAGADVLCKVLVGGELRSRKGLNLPGIDLGISAFTDRDRECLKFAIENGIDAVSQSFVESKEDLLAVRQAAKEFGRVPFIIAKIERSGALDRMDEILEVADGIMIARGDLGVEIPIERIAVVQKQLTRQANILGKPVITATQMLESMTNNRRPTRAEATDVANAILRHRLCHAFGRIRHGHISCRSGCHALKDCRGYGAFPPGPYIRETLRSILTGKEVDSGDLISVSVRAFWSACLSPRSLCPPMPAARRGEWQELRLPVWVTAAAHEEAVCRTLNFSYGVSPVHEPDDIDDWSDYAKTWTKNQDMEGTPLL